MSSNKPFLTLLLRYAVEMTTKTGKTLEIISEEIPEGKGDRQLTTPRADELGLLGEEL